MAAEAYPTCFASTRVFIIWNSRVVKYDFHVIIVQYLRRGWSNLLCMNVCSFYLNWALEINYERNYNFRRPKRTSFSCLRSKFSPKVCFLFSKNTSTHRFESEGARMKRCPSEPRWSNFWKVSCVACAAAARQPYGNNKTVPWRWTSLTEKICIYISDLSVAFEKKLHAGRLRLNVHLDSCWQIEVTWQFFGELMTASPVP